MTSRRAPLQIALAVVLAASSGLGAQARRTAPAPAKKPAPAKPAAPAAEMKVPFRAGETLTYNVGWSTYFTAGTATVRVQERRPLSGGRAAYILVAEGKPGSILSKLYDLYYKAETQLDTRTLLPLTASVFSKEGSRTRVKTTHFKGAGKTADYSLQTTNLTKRTLAVQPYTQDALAAIYVLRALPFKQGDSMAMPVTSGGDVYRARINYGGVESVSTDAGAFQAWKVSVNAIDQDGKPAARSMHIWFSNDARRLPVKIEAGLPVGSFTLTLANVR
jgi:hypothetical protein